MRTYQVTMINPRLNVMKTIEVKGYSCIDAGAESRNQLQPLGYTLIESIVCIAG